MRIGICTLPLAINYGGILQNYALQTVLKRMGHEVWTLDIGKYRWIDWLDNTWRVLAHKLLGHDVTFALTPPQRTIIETPLRNFVNSYIQLTIPRKNWFNKSLISKYQLEAIVVGSDQTWRPIYNKHIEDLYLQFTNGLRVHRIAYAASFGTDEWEYSDHDTRNCASLAKQFKAISVREKSGIKLCAEKLGVDAVHVLDPTMLLTSDDYKRLCKHIPVQPTFVFAYILDEDKRKIDEINNFASEKNMPCIIKRADQHIEVTDSIEKWLSLFRDAAFVITDSFHGAVFSILFQKDFLVYYNKNRGNARFDSLLEMFALKSRVLADNTSGPKPIDWKGVETLLDKERVRSIEWLRNNL